MTGVAINAPAGDGRAPGVRVGVAALTARERRCLSPCRDRVVALGALDPSVCSPEGKPGPVMDETITADGVKIGLLVTVRTRGSETVSVGIRVARRAGRFQADPEMGPVRSRLQGEHAR